MAVYYGASELRVRWRSAAPLGDKSNFQRPYTLTLEEALPMIDGGYC
jgi:hypothetical protein